MKNLMAATIHLALELLKQFVNGRLSKDGSEIVLRHLAQCDYCLERANEFWMADPDNIAAFQSADAALRLESSIMERVRKFKAESNL